MRDASRKGKAYGGVNILTDAMDQLGSYLAAIKYLEKNPRYDEEDIKNINCLTLENTRSQQLLAEGSGLTPPALALPEGWRLRMVGRQTFTVSPDGLQFGSRRKALQHRIEAGASQQEIQLMRTTMAEEGWQPSEFLPENWRTKRTTEPSGEVKTQFLSDQGDLIKSSAVNEVR